MGDSETEYFWPANFDGANALTRTYVLPSKIAFFLRRLEQEYIATNNKIKHAIIKHAKATVKVATSYDNWNGGQHGHSVVLFIPFEVFSLFRLSEQQSISEQIRTDLNSCTNVEDEYFDGVHIDPIDEDSADYQRAVGISDRPTVDPAQLSIWKPGTIRLFISHRDTHKALVKKLADALEAYGISSFVAHETIEPTKEWQREIMRGLETMEIMLAFLTNDFHESKWTNQEIGFALGRSVPVVSLKLETSDPSGFIGHKQALKGSLADPEGSALKLQGILSDMLGRKDRTQSALVAAFAVSPEWSEAKTRFERMSKAITKLTDDELETIVKAYAANDQLHYATYLNNGYERLVNFLKRTTGKTFKIESKTLKAVKLARDLQPSDDDIPF